MEKARRLNVFVVVRHFSVLQIPVTHTGKQTNKKTRVKTLPRQPLAEVETFVTYPDNDVSFISQQ